MHSFNNEARKLALQGVTIVVSSGDNGAAGDANWCQKDSSSDSVLWQVRCHLVCCHRIDVRCLFKVCFIELFAVCVLILVREGMCHHFYFSSLQLHRRLCAYCNYTGEEVERQGLFSLFPRNLAVRHCRGRHARTRKR